MLLLWGPERYGGWLALTALLAYTSLADLGLSQVTAIDMAMLAARGERPAARRVSQTLWALNAGAALLVTLATGAAAFALPIARLVNVSEESAAEVSLTTLLLGGAAALQVLYAAPSAGMKATGHFPLMVASGATLRFADAVVLATGAWVGLGFGGIALLLLCERMILTAGFCSYFYGREPWLLPRLAPGDRAILRRLLAPALSYLSYTLAQLISVQGVVLIVAALLGPGAVAVLSAIRTLTRAGRMASVIINHAAEPVLARLAGLDSAAFRAVARLQAVSAGGLTLAYAIAMMAAGPSILAWWTAGRVSGDSGLFTAMVLSVVAEMLWLTLQTPYLATNRHPRLALSNLIVALIGALATVGGVAWGGLDWAGYVSCGSNGAILFLTLLAGRMGRHDWTPSHAA
jgi:O-antigen/teichoic acid export membrane protein